MLTDDNFKRTDITWMLGQIKTAKLASMNRHKNVSGILGFNKGNNFKVMINGITNVTHDQNLQSW